MAADHIISPFTAKSSLGSLLVTPIPLAIAFPNANSLAKGDIGTGGGGGGGPIRPTSGFLYPRGDY